MLDVILFHEFKQAKIVIGNKGIANLEAPDGPVTNAIYPTRIQIKIRISNLTFLIKKKKTNPRNFKVLKNRVMVSNKTRKRDCFFKYEITPPYPDFE